MNSHTDKNPGCANSPALLGNLGWEVALVAVPFCLYLAATFPLRGWLIDDAGISLAYARNLAGGFGLVSQPGMPPVEGFSNFLWVVLVSPFYVLGFDQPYLIAKGISLTLIAICFWYLHRTMMIIAASRLVSLFALLFLSINASFVVWTCSGLENPLMASLMAALAYHLAKYAKAGRSDLQGSMILGLLAFSLTITRPDGIMYAAAFPLIAVLVHVAGKVGELRRFAANLAAYGAVFGFGLSSFLTFRWLYFGDLYPNTYYVKGGPTLGDLMAALTLRSPYLEKLQDLLGSLGGIVLWLAVPALLVFWIGWCARRRCLPKGDLVFISLGLLAALTYLLLRTDYMGEYRFATPFMVVVYPMVALIVFRVISGVTSSIRRQYLTVTVIILALGWAVVPNHYARLKTFYANPKIPFERIGAMYGEKFNRYAEYLGLSGVSLLAPDLGGTLYYSKLRVHDLAGLCDKTIAKTRGIRQQEFYDYVFDSLAPAFIHTHGYFTGVSKFDDDPRFSENYVALKSYEDAWVKQAANVVRLSGDFIRRDLVVGREAQVDSLKMGLVP